MNSVLKEKGGKKKELRKFNLFQLLEHILNQFNRFQARCVDQIKDLIKSKKEWSSYVDDIWMKAFQSISHLPFVQEKDSGQWVVSATNDFSVLSHCVIQSDPRMEGIPTCSCSDFSSTLIPCAGICAVFSRISDSLFVVNTLHPRWRLRNHPLYGKCIDMLNLRSLPSNGIPSQPPVGLEGDIAQHELDLEVYNTIIFPSKRDVRYTRLNQQFKKLEGRVINNEHAYKLMMMNLIAFENSLHGGTRASFILPSNSNSVQSRDFDQNRVDHPASSNLAIGLNPPSKRGRSSLNDDINRQIVSVQLYFNF